MLEKTLLFYKKENKYNTFIYSSKHHYNFFILNSKLTTCVTIIWKEQIHSEMSIRGTFVIKQKYHKLIKMRYFNRPKLC